MEVNWCPSCLKEITNLNRLITESCGHSKCRECFILEKNICIQCPSGSSSAYHKPKNIQISPEINVAESKIKKTIKDHIIVVGEQYKCLICDKEFRSRQQQYYHIYCDEPEELRPFKCDKCARGFLTENHLNYHITTHSSEKISCKICKKDFSNEITLHKHIKKHKQRKKYKCEVCDAEYRDEVSFKSHKIAHGETLNIKQIICTTCGKFFYSKSRLRRHEIIHRKDRKKLFECTVCNCKFFRASTLRIHKQKHENLCAYKCYICYKYFDDEKILRRHLNSHNESSVFQCEICDMKFNRKDNLMRHVRNMHPNKQLSTRSNIVDDNVAVKKSLPYKNETIINHDSEENTSLSDINISIVNLDNSATNLSTNNINNCPINYCINNIDISAINSTNKIEVAPLNYSNTSLNDNENNYCSSNINFSAINSHIDYVDKYRINSITSISENLPINTTMKNSTINTSKSSVNNSASSIFPKDVDIFPINYCTNSIDISVRNLDNSKCSTSISSIDAATISTSVSGIGFLSINTSGNNIDIPKINTSINIDANNTSISSIDISSINTSSSSIDNQEFGTSVNNCDIVQCEENSIIDLSINSSNLLHSQKSPTEDTSDKKCVPCSVIRSVGNAKPLKVVLSPRSTDKSISKIALSINSININALANKKLKKKYDPTEIYRKILFVNKDDDPTPSTSTGDVKKTDESFIESNTSNKSESTNSNDETTCSYSNFIEKHWRKKFL